MTLVLAGRFPRRVRRAGRWITGLTSGLTAVLTAENDRWFLWGTVLFGTGIAAYFALPAEPPWLAVASILVAAVVTSAVWQRGTGAIVVGGGILALALGVGAAKLRTATAGGPVLPRALMNADLRGYVELVEPRPGRGQRLTIRVRELQSLPPQQRPYRVRVRILSTATLAAGDPIRLKATLAAPALPALPGDYDFARAAWFQRIGAVGYSIRAPDRDDGAPPPPPDLAFWARLEGLRQAINQRIYAALPGETGALAAALITGERGGISDATNEAYRAAGIYHMLSISGLHMVIVAGAAFWVVRLLLALSPSIALRYPIREIAAVVAALAALGYLLISGGAPATARSWLTVTIGFLAVLADRPAIALRTVALSALLILAVFPETLLDVGFQMSYAAVVALVAAYEAIRLRTSAERDLETGTLRRIAVAIGGILLSTLIAGMATAPFSAYHFHQSQQYALITNFFAIPVCNVVIMPAALAAMMAMPLGLEAIPFTVMGWGLDLVTKVAEWVARMPGALLPVPAIPDASFALMVIGGLWLCLWQRRWRLLGLAVAAVGLALAPFKPRPDLLIGHDAHLVAARGADGVLQAASVKASAFEFKRWREYDGTPVARAVADATGLFRCDAAGCVVEVAGRRVAVPRHASALRDDCRLADIVVTASPRPRRCAPRDLIIDGPAVRDAGTHALRFVGGAIEVTTVADVRGERPWTGRRAGAKAGPTPPPTRLVQFPPGSGLGPETPPTRPEIEDEDPQPGIDERL